MPNGFNSFNKLDLSGGTLTGHLNIGLNSIIMNNGVNGGRIQGHASVPDTIQIIDISNTAYGKIHSGDVNFEDALNGGVAAPATLQGELDIGTNNLKMNDGVTGSILRGSRTTANRLYVVNMADSADGSLFVGAINMSGRLYGTASAYSQFIGQPRAGIYNSANQSIPNSTITIPAFDSTDFDIGGVDDLTNNRFVIPSNGAGVWYASATLYFAPNATGQRYLELMVGASIKDLHLITPNATYNNRLHVSAIITGLVATNIISLRCYQSSGGALNLIGGANVNRFECVKLW